MLYMSPDQISDLKKNQQLFPVKNQIDGKTLDIKSSLSRKGFRLSTSKASSLENNGIDKHSYNGVSDDPQEKNSENQDKMDMYHVKFQSPDKSNGKVAVNKLKSK